MLQRCERGIKGDINRNKESLDGIKGKMDNHRNVKVGLKRGLKNSKDN